MQDNRPVAYYSRKLNSAQKNYSTPEKELLSAVEILKEFRTTLLGANITVHTDHKNNTYDNLKSQRVLRRRLYLEDYSPTFKYIEGPNNVIADTFSRLDRRDSPVMVGKNAPSNGTSDNTFNNQDEYDLGYCSIFNDPHLVQCFTALEESYLNLPFENLDRNPLKISKIKEEQDADQALKRLKEKHPDWFLTKQLGQVHDVTCYVKPGSDRHRNWKVVLPDSMLKSTLSWFHQVLGHPGSMRLRLTLS